MSMSFDNSAFEVFRGINYAAQGQEYGEQSAAINLADMAAQDQANKTGATVLLEDFSEKYGFDGYNNSNVTDESANEFWPFMKSDNIFASDMGQKMLAEKGNYFQSDIFNDTASKYGGINYGNKENLSASALNFAKADINAIEKPYADAHPEDNELIFTTKDEKLFIGEVASYSNNVDKKSMEDVDLDGNANEITAEEYASFLLAADEDLDGIISQQEAEIVQNMDNDELKAQAQEMYNQCYKEERPKFLGIF